MNYFGMIVAVLQLGAGITAALKHDWRTTVIYCAFSVASAAIAWGVTK